MNESSRILVSLFAGEESSLRERLDWLHGKVGKIELRLDSLPETLNLSKLVTDYPKLEWYAACRVIPESESRTKRLMRAVNAGFHGVDFPLEDGVPPEVPEGVCRIHSWHQESADGADYAVVHESLRSRATGQDLLKMVAWADYAEQAWPVLDLYAKSDPASLLAFAQGPGGGASRILALRCGAPWIYSSWPGDATAPGQWNVVELLETLPQALNLQTPALGVVGNPVLHSLSPFLWQSAMREEQGKPFGLFLPFPVQNLPVFLQGAARFGLTAFSVTAPHKQDAFQHATPLAGSLGQAAAACQAANLLVQKDGGWQCGNSDGVGAMDALEVECFTTEDEKHLLLLGAGGAALAVQVEAEQRGWKVTTTHRAEIEKVQPENFDAVIQATPVGSVGHPGLLTPGRPPKPGTPSLDMVYHPLQTEWLQQAHAAGARAIPGTQMLLHQMLAQFAEVFPQVKAANLAKLQDELHAYLEKRQALVLVGARASGKTTLGRDIAKQLQWNFLDADDELERRSGREIQDWLSSDPTGFRDYEALVLKNLLAQPFTVVATGGGVVEREASVAQLASHARVVWLECSQEELYRRQMAVPRPALTDLDLAAEIESLLRKRSPAYRKASSLVVSTNETPDSAVMKVLGHFCMKRFVPGFG